MKGFQEHPEAPGEVMASACCKHYVANSMDGSTVDGHTATRVDFNAVISEQDLVDSYLAPFQDCVEQGEVTSLMCSYNSVNGKPSCANPWLLETVARDQWQFDGYITSDCDADANVFSTHHYTATPEEAVADVLHAGTDVDCGGFVQTHGASALAKGLITKGDIDTRLKYLFRMRIRLGHCKCNRSLCVFFRSLKSSGVDQSTRPARCSRSRRRRSARRRRSRSLVTGRSRAA